MTSSNDQALDIEIVMNKRQLREFIQLPETIYCNDPHWVAPLLIEQRQRLSDNSPFLHGSHWRLWLVRRGQRVVGRISAQVNAQHQQYYRDNIGYFGMLEAEDDPQVFALLLHTAEQWLRQQGMIKVRGPFNMSINQEIGLLVDGFTTPPFVMMGHAHPYLGKQIEACHYSKAIDVLAYYMRLGFATPKAMAILMRWAEKKVTMRCFDKKKSRQELAMLRDLFNDAWSDNWGFVPFTREQFDDIGHMITVLLDKSFIQIAEIDNQPVAFIVAMPNVNEAIRDLNGRLLPFGWLKLLWRLKVQYPTTARVVLMGVKKSYQNSRLGTALAFMVIDRVHQALIKRGVVAVEMGWILETNKGMRSIIEAIGGSAYKRYRLYQKSL